MKDNSFELLVQALRSHLNQRATVASQTVTGDPVWVKLARFDMDGYHMESGYLNAVVDEWLRSEQAAWAVENIGRFEVYSHKRTDTFSVHIIIAAKVDRSLAVEHALRWDDA